MQDLLDDSSFGAVVLPVQFNDAVRRRNSLSGEQRLMLAVLEDAIGLYLKSAHRLNGEQARVAYQARDWVESRGDRGIFAYQTICDFLGIDADALRGALKRTVSDTRLHLRRGGRGRFVQVTPNRPRKVEAAA